MQLNKIWEPLTFDNIDVDRSSSPDFLHMQYKNFWRCYSGIFSNILEAQNVGIKCLIEKSAVPN